jgi:hypothetical protein
MVCPPKLPLHQRGGAIRRRNRGYETLADIARSYNVSPATLPPASPPLCHGRVPAGHVTVAVWHASRRADKA